jgi:putative DNA primase/helicase
MDELKKRELLKKGIIYYDKREKLHISIPNTTKEIMEKYTFLTIMGKKQEEIYYYNNPIWINGGKQIIYEEVENLLEDLCNSNFVKEIEAKIKRKTFINKEDFERIDEELICVENGVLNLITGELIREDKNYYFKTMLPIKFNKEATCQNILDFFNEIFYPEDIPVIQEWLGFCLYRRYFIKKAMILVGEKNTGKTVFLNILNSFIGNHNTSGINLQRISAGDKFGLASLKGKLVNLFDDLSNKDLADGGGFKIATGGGYITAEFKFGDSFQFMNYAKHIFATNKIPPAKDTNDDAYYERWIPIQLDNQCPIEKQNPFLVKELTKQEELSGLLNWAIEGLRRLLVNGKFSYKKSSYDIKYIMERSSHPLASFVRDRLVQEVGNKISKDLMFQSYAIYCDENKLPRLSKEQLGRQLPNYCYYIMAKHNTNERYWENAKFK